ncbi:unnamed protein product [Cyprideis torosa]|uniref:Uncharacterized protein n=1 Tax=Cyprideis torosa TaxID=163714 RepID=A0A7R8WEM1_9CRUS|nr:unnamed protein product [Cyprideis torosa]CAG0889668.1 unnamed protein product [Cyprideis torosa]
MLSSWWLVLLWTVKVTSCQDSVASSNEREDELQRAADAWIPPEDEELTLRRDPECLTKGTRGGLPCGPTRIIRVSPTSNSKNASSEKTCSKITHAIDALKAELSRSISASTRSLEQSLTPLKQLQGSLTEISRLPKIGPAQTSNNPELQGLISSLKALAFALHEQKSNGPFRGGSSNANKDPDKDVHNIINVYTNCSNCSHNCTMDNETMMILHIMGICLSLAAILCALLLCSLICFLISLLIGLILGGAMGDDYQFRSGNAASRMKQRFKTMVSGLEDGAKKRWNQRTEDRQVFLAESEETDPSDSKRFKKGLKKRGGLVEQPDPTLLEKKLAAETLGVMDKPKLAIPPLEDVRTKIMDTKDFRAKMEKESGKETAHPLKDTAKDLTVKMTKTIPLKQQIAMPQKTLEPTLKAAEAKAETSKAPWPLTKQADLESLPSSEKKIYCIIEPYIQSLSKINPHLHPSRTTFQPPTSATFNAVSPPPATAGTPSWTEREESFDITTATLTGIHNAFQDILLRLLLLLLLSSSHQFPAPQDALGRSGLSAKKGRLSTDSTASGLLDPLFAPGPFFSRGKDQSRGGDQDRVDAATGKEGCVETIPSHLYGSMTEGQVNTYFSECLNTVAPDISDVEQDVQRVSGGDTDTGYSSTETVTKFTKLQGSLTQLLRMKTGNLRY